MRRPAGAAVAPRRARAAVVVAVVATLSRPVPRAPHAAEGRRRRVRDGEAVLRREPRAEKRGSSEIERRLVGPLRAERVPGEEGSESKVLGDVPGRLGRQALREARSRLPLGPRAARRAVVPSASTARVPVGVAARLRPQVGLRHVEGGPVAVLDLDEAVAGEAALRAAPDREVYPRVGDADVGREHLRVQAASRPDGFALPPLEEVLQLHRGGRDLLQEKVPVLHRVAARHDALERDHLFDLEVLEEAILLVVSRPIAQRLHLGVLLSR